MGIRARCGMVLAVIMAAGLAACTGPDGAFAESKAGPDPGWLQFRLVYQASPVEPGESGVAEASVDTLDGVWEKVGAEAADLAQSLSEAPTDPEVLEVLEPFAGLAPDEVDLLPLEVRLYAPIIGCDQLRPSMGYFEPGDETVACEPEAEGTKKLHLGLSELDGADVAMASSRPMPSDPAEYQLVLEMTDEGAERLSGLTTDHVDERLAILLTDEVVIAPVIQEPIPGGVVQIPGGFSRQEAEDLARIINSATKVPG